MIARKFALFALLGLCVLGSLAVVSAKERPGRPPVAMTPGQSCAACHSAHATDSGAHAKLEKGCQACHVPQRGQHAFTLASPLEKLCAGCHAKLEEHIAKSASRHAPLAKGDCGACHELHSGVPNLLARSFPEKIYAPFATGAYRLCFSCHSQRLVVEKQTTKATAFRDGDRNLHAAHVLKEKGRTCRTCHDPHAAGPKLVAASFHFGDWQQAPVGWKPTPSGGSCAPACHVTRSYDRGALATVTTITTPGGGR